MAVPVDGTGTASVEIVKARRTRPLKAKKGRRGHCKQLRGRQGHCSASKLDLVDFWITVTLNFLKKSMPRPAKSACKKLDVKNLP